MSSPASNPNLPSATALAGAREWIGTIRDRYRRSLQRASQRIPYSGSDFEADLHACLSSWFNYCVLPGIRVFSPSRRATGELAHELDNIFHLRMGDTDFIVLVEAKAQPVRIEGGEWQVSYGDRISCARKQVDEHIRTMWEYLEPITRDIKLQFVAIVVSPDTSTPEAVKPGYRNAELALLSTDKLIPYIHERFNFEQSADLALPELFRVSQSPFLDLLRLSMPIHALGHPELSSAIRYVDRCRRVLDQTLFDDFKPRAERWLINGSAGMGKSVLLAYAAAVLSSGRELYRFQGETGVKEATEVMKTAAFDPAAGPIAMLAMSAKQLESLQGWFDFFVTLFEESDLSGDLHFRRPEFLLARNVGDWATYKRTFSAVFLDEAHDLPDHAAHTLKEIYDQTPFYLVVACDRHQQLKLSGADARVMKGFDFSGKGIRLKQIYRNPAPIYIASLALMFRWFGEGGPKVIPSDKEFSSSFGFDAVRLRKNEPTLTMKNDAHPANSWSHVVAAFPDVATAAATLRREKLGRKEVLWVRFSEEHPDFDYESLQHDFTYHNCRSREAHILSDKYIKGQDFPVVVIEGFPTFMEKFSSEEEESKMWQFRRELYLCASRATCFLYFVCDVKETDEVVSIRSEISRLLEAVGSPHATPDATGSKPWTFRITKPDEVRDHEVFLDARDEVEEEEAPSGDPSSPSTDTSTGTIAAPPVQISDKQEVLETSPEKTIAEPAPKHSSDPGDDDSSSKADPEATQEEAEPVVWELTIPKPMTAKQFSILSGVELFRVTEALNEIRCFVGPNRPISITNLARIAPNFNCYVIDEHGEPVSTAPEAEVDEEPVTRSPVSHSTNPTSPAADDIESPEPQTEEKGDDGVYVIEGSVVVAELAERMGLKSFQLLADLIKMQVFVAPHQEIDGITASKICKLHQFPYRLGKKFKVRGAGREKNEGEKEVEKSAKAAKRKAAGRKDPPKKASGQGNMHSLAQAFEETTYSKQESHSRVFALRKGVMVRQGVWIEDKDHGIGKIHRLCSTSRDMDSHEVWFEKLDKVVKNHRLRGHTSKILHVSKVPEEIRNRAPKE